MRNVSLKVLVKSLKFLFKKGYEPCGKERVNPLSPKIHIQILPTDLHTFLLRIVERIWFKIKVFSLW